LCVLADEQLSPEQVTGRKIPLSPFLCPKLLSKRRGGGDKGIGSKKFWADSFVARVSFANRESTNEHSAPNRGGFITASEAKTDAEG